MEVSLRSLGITKSGDVRSLISKNNALPYKDRDRRLSVLYDAIVAYNMSSKCEGKCIKTSADAFEALMPYMSHLEVEEFHVLYLNKGCKILKHSKLSMGGISSTVADVRLLAKEALMCNAVNVIIAHNHPSGVLTFSHADKALTDKIRKGLDLLSITLMDHIVIAGGEYFSFSDRGEL